MFNFIQWDNPLTLLIEVALSIVVLVALMWVARRVNATSAPPSRNMDHQLQDGDANTSATQQGTQETHTVEHQSKNAHT
ncbi:MAG TPA: hypothetical protein VEW94_13765, partial [Chloroflexia bacterium]|nr:hypothetical protein [Chloroflexia bacterium]